MKRRSYLVVGLNGIFIVVNRLDETGPKSLSSSK